MSGSAIPSAKEAIEKALEGAAGLKGVPIYRGKPEPAPADYIALWAGTAEREFRMLGPQPPPLDEEGTITLVVDSLRASGEDFKAAEDRAWELFKTAEAALRADVTLGGVWHFGERVMKLKQEYHRTDKKRGCRIWLTLTGKARI